MFKGRKAQGLSVERAERDKLQRWSVLESVMRRMYSHHDSGCVRTDDCVIVCHSCSPSVDEHMNYSCAITVPIS